MLETAEERVKLLKLGFSGKEIEKLYIEYNNFKIIHSPILFELCGWLDERFESAYIEAFFGCAANGRYGLQKKGTLNSIAH